MLAKCSLVALLAAGLVASVGCSSSNFASGAGGTKSSSKKDKKEDDEDDKDVDQEDHEPKDEGETETGEDPKEEDPKTDEDDAKAKAGELVNEEEAACLLKKGDDFRILFLLDNSGSTTKTDPTNVRRTAAMKLIDQFTDFVIANPKAKFYTASVAVHGGATAGANGWVELAKETREKIEEDVIMATEKDPGLGTFFATGFEEVKKAFGAVNASATKKRERNFVIFLTDGQANGPSDTMTYLPENMGAMVDTFGLAVYSIMITKPAKKNGIDSEKLMQSLALPTTGKVGDDHVGTYVNAVDASAIEKAFADFFTKVTTYGCE